MIMDPPIPDSCSKCKIGFVYGKDKTRCITSDRAIFLCYKCYELEKDKKYKCAHCDNESDNKIQFEMKFVNLNTVNVTKLCSYECRLKQVKFAEECGKCETFGLMCVCNYCGITKKNMAKCSLCKYVRYCSVQCQKNDWSKHKNNCKKV